MLFIFIIFAVWAQPSFPPGSACTPEYLFPCSFETAIDASEPLKTAAQSLDKNALIADYQTGKYDVDSFEPILFSDTGTTYGFTEAQTHPVISDRVMHNVLTTLQTSQQDWLETDWGDDIDESTKFVYDVDLPNNMNSAVFLRTSFADPWAGECSTSDYTAVCAQWNLAVSLAKTFYSFAKCSGSSEWDSTVTQYQSGDYGVGGSYASLFVNSGAAITTTNFTTHDSFPSGITTPRVWTNFTNATWGYFLEFRRFDGATYKVLAELSIPQEEPSQPTQDVVEEAHDITDIVNDDTKNSTEQESEIIDLIDETDVTSVVIVTNETKTTISEGTVDTVSDETTSTELPPASPEPEWIRFDDSIGVLTYTDDETAVISLIYEGYTEVADGACNGLYDMACNRNAVPYYASNVVLDLLNAGTNSTKVDLVLDQVRAGLYDRSNNYKPSVMNEAGIHVAQSSPDGLYDALVSSNAEPDFSQHRLQLAWIATAAGGEPQWVSMNLDNQPWEIYVQVVETNIVMLGYLAVTSISSTGAEAAGEGNADSESNDTTLYIIIGICVFVALIILVTIFSWLFCRPKPVKKRDAADFDEGDAAVAAAERGEAVGEEPHGHWVQYVGGTDAGPSSGTELTGFATEGEYEQVRGSTKSVDVHM